MTKERLNQLVEELSKLGHSRIYLWDWAANKSTDDLIAVFVKLRAQTPRYELLDLKEGYRSPYTRDDLSPLDKCRGRAFPLYQYITEDRGTDVPDFDDEYNQNERLYEEYLKNTAPVELDKQKNWLWLL